MIIKNLEKHFDKFEKTSITLKTSIEEKRKIIEENKFKRVLVQTLQTKDSNKYFLGQIERINEKTFGLGVLDRKIPQELNYHANISYSKLCELLVYKHG
jgi:hypothetical protein